MRFLLVFLLIPFTISAQFNKNFVAKSDLYYTRIEYSGNGLFGFESNGKFGYMDVNQKIVIPATLDLKLTSSQTMPSFTNGFAVVSSNGKSGLIDKTGKLVIPYDYSSLWLYSNQKNTVKAGKEVDNKTVYGVLNTQNKLIIPFEYSSISADSNLFMVAKNGKYGVLDINGKELVPAEFYNITTYSKDRVAKAEKDGKYGFIDLKGNWLFEKSKSVFTFYGCNAGMVRCKVSNKFGYLDLKGNEAIITKYDYAEDFNDDGIARVGISNSDTKYKTLYGYINKKGEVVIPLKYETLSFFVNGAAIAKDPETNRYGFLDKKGKWFLNPVYVYTSSGFDDNGGVWVKMTDNKYHYINKTGKDFGTLDSIGNDTKQFKDGYSVVTNTSYPYVLIDQTGKTLKTIDDVDAIYSFAENIAGYKSKKTSLYGFIDINGNKIGNPDFTGFNGFSEGLAKVSKNINGKTRHGYINTKGEIVFPLEYETAGSFGDGWALVTKDSILYFMDKKGTLNDWADEYQYLNDFRDGFALGYDVNVNAPNDYHYINKELKEVFSIKAKAAYPFWEDVAVIKRDSIYELINKKGESVKLLKGIDFLKFSNEGKLAVRSNNKWGYIDMKGNQVIPFQYDSCDSFKGDYAKVQVDGKWGIIDKTGKTIIKPQYKNITPGDNGIFIFFDQAWGITDKTGKIISNDIFLSITPFSNNKALARRGKSFTILKSPLAK
ncbi:MAG: WG repeat-containing protein [Chitinophagaceae bacterium]|nr:WG repeat-containing protein [Chitinophagaceae bacterium]